MEKPLGLYFFYGLALGVIKLGLAIAALFSKKIRFFLNGRKNVWSQLAAAQLKTPIWIHVASLGEFEQVRPLIEQLNAHYPKQELLLTFFSPSGYEIQKNYPLVKTVTYLPLEGRRNAKRFISMVQPKLVLLVKNEFWPSYLNVLAEKKITTISISSKFSARQFFFKPYGKFGLKVLKKIAHFYVQDTEGKQLLAQHGFQNVTVSGDTRFDRVAQLSADPKTYPALAQQLKTEKCIVFGSVWEADFSVFENWINTQKEGWKAIIAPHQIDAASLALMEKRLAINVVRWKHFLAHPKPFDALLIDSIGDLKHLYQFADVVYVGGGMKPKALHNILEPAAFGKALLIGTYYSDFPEAIALLQEGGLESIAAASQWEAYFKNINTTALQEKGKSNRRYVEQHLGATDCIYDGIIALIG